MATFELRRDAQGRVNAVRVKVRRVGQPHLSKTFQLDGRGPAALAAARREAAQWLAGLDAALDSVAQEMVSATSNAAMPVAEAEVSVASAFKRATTEAVVNQRRQGEHVVSVKAEADPTLRLLRELLQCGAMSLAELSALRWQHVAWHERCLQVPGGSGLVVRHVPLGASACEALLAMGTRKHGLLFPGGPEWLVAALPALTEVGATKPVPQVAPPAT